MSTCAQFNLPIVEHSQETIKQKAVTGNGSAQKDQVAKMIMHLLEARYSASRRCC